MNILRLFILFSIFPIVMACTPIIRSAAVSTDDSDDEDGGGGGGGGGGGNSLIASQISAGGNNTCIINGDRRIICWGDNTGAYFTAGAASSSSLMEVDPSNTYGDIQVEGFNICARTYPGSELKCWGDNSLGQHGNGTVAFSNSPGLSVESGAVYDAVSIGYTFACGITSTNVKCWGVNALNQLGFATSSSSTPVMAASNITAVSSGYFHSCALTTTGTVRCWGNNPWGQAGGVSATVATPTAVVGTYSAISVGHTFSCAIKTNGQLACWGKNDRGQLGTGGVSASEDSPRDIADTSTYSKISVGSDHACGITTDGALKCWGDNTEGESGTGTAGGYNDEPTAVDVMTTYIEVSCGGLYAYGGHCCAITSAGAVKCWGWNDSGQTGATTASYPVAVPL